jgi:transcriptional regulator with XRE-family HTH domain
MGKKLYSANREIFRELLRSVRLEAELTQVALCSKLKRPQSYVSDYERGHRRLDWVAVDEVLAACNISLVAFARRYAEAVGPR